MKRKVALALGLVVVAVIGFKMGGMFSPGEDIDFGPGTEIFEQEEFDLEESPTQEFIEKPLVPESSDGSQDEHVEKLGKSLHSLATK